MIFLTNKQKATSTSISHQPCLNQRVPHGHWRKYKACNSVPCGLSNGGNKLSVWTSHAAHTCCHDHLKVCISCIHTFSYIKNQLWHLPFDTFKLLLCADHRLYKLFIHNPCCLILATGLVCLAVTTGPFIPQVSYCCGQWPNYMDKYVRTGTSAL